MTTRVRAGFGGMDDGAFNAVLRWIIYIALLCLGTAVLWDYGLLGYLYTADASRLSVVITVLFLAFCLHCLWLLIWMSREYRQVLAVARMLEATRGPIPQEGGQIPLLAGQVAQQGLLAGYLRDLVPTVVRQTEGDRQVLLQSFAASLRRHTRVGAYGTDLLYKLGMLGTMIGFVMMLNSMGDMTDFDVETLRGALQKMIAGMAVSLLTTIAGLVGGILLRVQYNIAEGLATDIVQTTVKLTETALVPRLRQAGATVGATIGAGGSA